jgi:hypothetical protein
MEVTSGKIHIIYTAWSQDWQYIFMKIFWGLDLVAPHLGFVNALTPISNY